MVILLLLHKSVLLKMRFLIKLKLVLYLLNNIQTNFLFQEKDHINLALKLGAYQAGGDDIVKMVSYIVYNKSFHLLNFFLFDSVYMLNVEDFTHFPNFDSFHKMCC